MPLTSKNCLLSCCRSHEHQIRLHALAARSPWVSHSPAFPRTSVVQTLRPRIVGSLDEPIFIDDFLRRVRQSFIFG